MTFAYGRGWFRLACTRERWSLNSSYQPQTLFLQSFLCHFTHDIFAKTT